MLKPSNLISRLYSRVTIFGTRALAVTKINPSVLTVIIAIDLTSLNAVFATKDQNSE